MKREELLRAIHELLEVASIKALKRVYIFILNTI